MGSSKNDENTRFGPRPAQELRFAHGRGRDRLRDPGRGVLRFPWTERRREDDDRQDDPLRLSRNLGNPDRQRPAGAHQQRALKKMTGIIPQEITLDVDLTVYENLIIFSKFFDIPRREAKRGSPSS